ncbi:YvcK family protein [Fodinisporobacter ferrooxydans]|uniref:Gluconeogenesis factor n=1 Tax=Fodinisporobacter ferrooxydans TaxID=2901836 RepID=A0ABY4CLE9_9BACL|nr:YvcK family protein [Alicyclobacillaceae bacterium MYW30-H2]
MFKTWWIIAWTTCIFGLGVILDHIEAFQPAGRKLPDVGIVAFAVGLILLIAGWVRERTSVNHKIKNPPVPQRRPHIVAIGGGTGLSVLLRGLKEFDVNITAIVTVADDGGSSGRLRTEFSMPAPGDIRNCLVALADTEPLLEKLWQYRFKSGEGLAGHTFGNLFLAAMMHVTGDFESAVREANRVLAVRGRVLPAAADDIKLIATASDGTEIIGESNIPKAGKAIARLQIDPVDVKPLPEVLQAIEQADIIVIGPGSLYTSVLPNLLIEGVAERIRNSTARKIYVCNVMTQPGETDHYYASSHVKTIYDHVGDQFFDTILVNRTDIPDYVLQKYLDQGAKPVEADIEELRKLGLHVIVRNVLQYSTYARHDPKVLAEIILSLVKKDTNES